MSVRTSLQASPDDSGLVRVLKFLAKLLLEGGLFLGLAVFAAFLTRTLFGTITLLGRPITGPAAGVTLLIFLARQWCFLTLDEPF
ncbi:hypothetical protein ACOJIV_18035 [Haloarcula sp. AONF1]